MSEDDKKIADSIRNGKYFAESRSWFQAVYLGPISERSFFLIVAALCVMITIFSVTAVMSLLPLNPKRPLLILSGDRPDDIQPTLVEITKGKKDNNPEIAKFLVLQYVDAREGYMFQTFARNALFIRAQSDEATYAAYVAAYNPNNPNSPFAGMNENGKRIITPITIRHTFNGGGGSAQVEFVAESTGVENAGKTKWTARIDYLYTQMTTTMVKNAKTGAQELSITDPQFQVVSYALDQNQ